MVKPLKSAELAILAAGPPDHRPGDERGWKLERNKYDRLVKRQRDLEAAVEPRRSSRLASKTLHVSDEWLQKNHPWLRDVKIGSPVGTSDGLHVERSISASMATPGGGSQVRSDVVVYTNPPPDERGSELKRCIDRAHRCAGLAH